MIDTCPECGGEVIEQTLSVLLDWDPMVLTIEVAICTECDWITIIDWDRGDRPHTAEFSQVATDTNIYSYPQDFNEDTTISL